jgi:glyoxylase-like metal-dependent hydrolase (beta-lactamase superfamily II)
MSDIPFNRDFQPAHEKSVDIAPGVRRITAANPSPFTFHGTNSYIIGRGRVAIVDPGPDDAAHAAALLEATRGENVSHIFVTHTHRDHSGAVGRLKAATGAKTVAAGPHRFARAPRPDESAALDAAADTAFVPDIVLADGASMSGDGWSLEAITTPGHTGNHLAFGLAGRDLIFSGDHVMGWSTTVVAPPDGSMSDYMASLDKLMARSERIYLPGHGGPVMDAQGFVRGLKAHRKMREAAILERLAKGDETIPAMVRAIYRDTDPRLYGAAGLSVLAHLEDLTSRGKVATDDPPAMGSRFRLS